MHKHFPCAATLCVCICGHAKRVRWIQNCKFVEWKCMARWQCQWKHNVCVYINHSHFVVHDPLLYRLCWSHINAISNILPVFMSSDHRVYMFATHIDPHIAHKGQSILKETFYRSFVFCVHVSFEFTQNSCCGKMLCVWPLTVLVRCYNKILRKCISYVFFGLTWVSKKSMQTNRTHKNRQSIKIETKNVLEFDFFTKIYKICNLMEWSQARLEWIV